MPDLSILSTIFVENESSVISPLLQGFVSLNVWNHLMLLKLLCGSIYSFRKEAINDVVEGSEIAVWTEDIQSLPVFFLVTSVEQKR